ncbi:MAG: hypothetical protein WCX65_19045, partial [bacterium]
SPPYLFFSHLPLFMTLFFKFIFSLFRLNSYSSELGPPFPALCASVHFTAFRFSPYLNATLRRRRRNCTRRPIRQKYRIRDSSYTRFPVRLSVHKKQSVFSTSAFLDESSRCFTRLTFSSLRTALLVLLILQLSAAPHFPYKPSAL